MDSVYECLSILKKKGRVTKNNLRLSFHLSDEQIDEMTSCKLIKLIDHLLCAAGKRSLLRDVQAAEAL